jgi:endonuclease-8
MWKSAMPEGHTIHRIARDHQNWFAGQKLIVSSPQGRFEEGASKISGKKLRDVTAHGKHLFYHWNRNLIGHVHLGLYGKFRLHKNPPPEPRGAVRVRMIGEEKSFDLNGPNCCELIDKAKHEELRLRLGEDPLRDDASAEWVWQRMQKSRSAIGSLLLNQSVIAGVGNVYRAEILFLLGIHPQLPANQIERKTFDELWNLTVELLQIGVKHNRIITTGFNFSGKVPKRLKASERLNIYKRSSCPSCDSPVKTWELANRKMYACGKCQKL